MSHDQEKYREEKILWQIITQLIQYHSAVHPEMKTIKRSDALLTYFPTPLDDPKRPYDEHANRFSEVLWDTLQNTNVIFDLNLKYDFEFHQEWELFETVGEYWAYMVVKVKGLEHVLNMRQ